MTDAQQPPTQHSSSTFTYDQRREIEAIVRTVVPAAVRDMQMFGTATSRRQRRGSVAGEA